MKWDGPTRRREKPMIPTMPSSDITQLFESSWAAFTTAWQQSSTAQSVWLTVGGSVIQLSFATATVRAQFLPALAHLMVPAQGKATFEIAIWDSASTGVPMVPAPWTADDYLARGEIRGVAADDVVQVAYHPGSSILSMFHRGEKKALVWMANIEECPYYEQAAPLRTILHWWSAAQGQQLVHGAAIGTEEGAVLITGKGGSGKSTTALSALVAGMLYLGDDYVLCALSECTAHVFSIYNSAKIDRNTLKFLALSPHLLHNRDRFLDEAQQGAEPEKGVLLGQEHFPDQLCASLPLRALIVPKITGEAVARLQPLKPTQAFIALAPTTVFQLPGAQQAALAFLRRLVVQLPCYQLQLGRDLPQAHALIRSLLRGAA